jgi:hypothetical protein
LLRFVPLFFVAAVVCTPWSIAPAHAGEIGQDKHGTWTASGSCSDKVRLVISSSRISIFKDQREHALVHADESVWKGETLINASRASIGDADPNIALTARVVAEDGRSNLIIDKSEAALTGHFRKCSDATMHVAKASPPKKAQAKPIRSAQRKPVGSTSKQNAHGAVASLGGLF